MNKTQLQKVRDALWLPENSTDEEFAQFSEAFAILDAALAQSEPEPVEWQERQKIYRKGDGFRWSAWYHCSYKTHQVIVARKTATEYEWRPLYTAPPAAKHDVLAALRECLAELKAHNESAYCELRGGFDGVIERAENALAKSTGEQA